MDCGGTFSAAFRLQSIRMELAAATGLDWRVRQVDIEATLLLADFLGGGLHPRGSCL